MTHPRMYDDGDTALARVRHLALAMPHAQEKESHGRPAFFTTKVFAYFAGSLKVGADWVQHGKSIVVQLDTDERAALLTEERCWVPGYLGPSGWIGIDIDEDTDWAEVSEIIEASFRMTAPKGLVEILDDRWRG